MLRIMFCFAALLLSSFVLGHGMSAEDEARALNASYVDFIALGATHMLTGYDHLLFLFGVIFFLTRIKDIFTFITAFTIGHSITLVFATLYHIQANYYLIDAIIALTVCYKAFDNLNGFKRYLHLESPNLMWMVFIFGLIHGFGLSTRLQQLPLAEDGLVLRILSFNVGVEFGQIFALTIMLLLLAGWRKTRMFEKFNRTTNLALLSAGVLLFLFQLHGYQHSQYPDDFPLNQDDHHHIHEAMKRNTAPTIDATLQYTPENGFQLMPPASEEAFKMVPDVHSHDGQNFHTH